MNQTYKIAGVLVKEPGKAGEKLQQILTAYGCVIRSRLGINNEKFKGGVIILDLTGDENEIELLINKLNNLEGIEVHYMDFN